MDLNTLLIIAIILVAGILVAVGIYLILVLIEARETLRQINKNLSHTQSILNILDEKIAQPAGSLLGVLGVVKEVANIFSSFKSGKKTKDRDGEL